ncbi:hypothetical protein PSA7680_01910 [Pseudoruegeria aquimaris]|uniref:Outer membrane protein beta-barrel domain-containing protein n=1 Tax=Pseudoruegeria aquimaris TaxID=393663 RepID=A0A1Y5SIS4_9RHOB|nr:outer membrane beta-barrel protein [Pseudoruegeria aquimaris]SLN38582.1 hypothetical protein PSA7680_01910 [Pseudoruegeria aquimaris]
MKLRTALAATAAAFLAAPLSAQSLDDFTGFYAGAQLGYGDVGTNAPGVSGDDWIGGIILGYDYDFGDWVIGGGIDYDWADINIAAGVDVESVWRIKARGGYNWDNSLIYATAGYADAGTNALGSSDGWLAGIGYEYRVRSDLSLGAELLYHEFDDFNGSGIDVDATTVQFRASYRF